MYTDQEIPQETIEEILEAANWAPNHKKTEPWRFKVMRGDALVRLGEYLSDFYQENTPAEKFSEKKFEKMRNKPPKASAVIALCMQRDPDERLPEWEEQAALAMAVQNMWLMCTAHNIGCYWGSPRAMLHAEEFLGLKEGEKCFGIFFMGYHKAPDLPAERGPIAEKVEWIDA